MIYKLIPWYNCSTLTVMKYYSQDYPVIWSLVSFTGLSLFFSYSIQLACSRMPSFFFFKPPLYGNVLVMFFLLLLIERRVSTLWLIKMVVTYPKPATGLHQCWRTIADKDPFLPPSGYNLAE